MSQVYQQALQRALKGLSTAQESSTDTGFCTSTPDNSRIKTSRAIGYVADNEDLKPKSDTHSQNQYNRHLTDNYSSINSGYPGRYTTKPDNNSSAANINSDSTNDRASNVNSGHNSRYSNSYLRPDSSNRYGNSSNRSVSPAQTTERSVSPSPGYRISSRYRTSSPRPQASLDTSSETKENTAPASPSLLGSVEYLGRYKPRYSSSSDQGTNSRPATPTSQSASRSSNETTTRETTSSRSSEGSPGYSGRYQYRYPSRAYNYGSSVTSNQENSNNLTTSGSKSTASDELSPASSSISYSTTSQHSPKDSRAQESSNRDTNPPAYRYSYSSQSSPKTETTQQSPKLKVTSPSQPVTISTTYKYSYPSRYSQHSTTESSNLTESETAANKKTERDDTSVFRYPYRYSSLSTDNQKQNQKQEEENSQDQEEWTTTTETYKIPRSSTSSQNYQNQTSKSENQKEELKTSTESYRYPYSTSSFRSPQNQNQPSEGSEKGDTNQEEEEGWTTTTETYKYPKSKYSNQTSPLAQTTSSEQSKSSVSSTQSSDTASRSRYPYTSRYSSSENEVKVEAQIDSQKPEAQTEVSSTNSYRYPYSSRYGSSSTEAKVAEPEKTKVKSPEPEVSTPYSYRSPYNRSSSSQPVTSTPIKTEEQPLEQDQSRSRYTYKYPSRSSYGSSSINTEDKKTDASEKEPNNESEVKSTSYSYRYPRSSSSQSDETPKSPKAESQPPEDDNVVTQTYTYKYPSGAYNFKIRSEPAKKSPEPEDQKSNSIQSKTETEENELDEEVFTETVSYKLPKSYGQSVERSSQEKMPEPETKTTSSYNYQTSSSPVTENKPEDQRNSDSNSRYQYQYRYPSRSYNFKTVSQSETEEKPDNQRISSTNQESGTLQADTLSSNRSSTSSMSNMTSISQQTSQTKEVLSPALAPRSPGTKHIDKTPKYIFSMGSRTVVEPQVPTSVVRSTSKDENENEEPIVKEEIVENAEQPEDEEEEDPEDSMSAQEILDLAKQKLEELHLAEADRLFMRCHQKLNDVPEDNYQKLIEIFFGLSEVCTRRSKQRRKSPLEWQWQCVHAAALLAEAAELCALEAKSKDPEVAEFYQDKRVFADNRNKSLEDLLCRTLYNWLSDGWRAVDPTRVSLLNAMRKTNISSSLFPMSNMLGLKPYQSGFLAQALSIESLHEMPSSLQGASLDTKSNWFRRIHLYCLKRMANKNRQEVLDEVLQFSKDTKKTDSQELGSDDEDETKDDTTEEQPLGPQEDADQNDEVHNEDANEDTEKHPEVINSPLSQKPVKLTVAKVFHRVVARLIAEEDYTKAELLCEEILQIVEDIQDGTIRMLKFSGALQQNLGILCLKQGDISKGISCLEVALNIFRDLQDGDAHREVSLVLLDMGNAYVASSLSEDQLYQAIIAAIRVFFEKEACDDNDQGQTTPEMIRSKEQDPTNKEEEKQKANINEAIRCYQEALEVLEVNAQSDLETIARALMKLGDCYFIQTEYSKALDSYEKAAPMFTNAHVFGKDHFLQHGHVMLMLGVSTFMLHVYPRAATIFEIAYTMVKHAHKLEINTFLHALLLSLRGIANYKMKTYHKCVSLCYQAFEIFWNMHGEGVVSVSHERFWLICQNLYILGNSYNVLNLQHKAIKYLDIGRAFMRATKIGEKRQFIRILNILGDCYFAQYDYKTALVYYNEALETGEPAKEEDQTDGQAASEDEMNQSTEDMALHNELLSKSAEANISMNQYENAIEYLEQARDMQDVMGEDIKGDLVSTLYQLGQMHSMAGDVDKAIDSYKESLEVFKELHNNLGPEMCVTLGNLATMCYVKACICEDIASELQMILAAEGYFQEALKLELNQSVCVKYANFLYSQGNYEDAIMYLEDALKSKTNLPEIVYGGLEKVTLPEALQDEVDAQEEVEMPSVCLGHFLEVLSYKMLGKTRHSDKCLLKLLKSVYDTDSPFLRSVLGYALMEMGLFEEAAVNFRAACEIDPEYHLALDNYCLCMCLMVLESLNSALKNIFIHYRIWYDEMEMTTPAIHGHLD